MILEILASFLIYSFSFFLLFFLHHKQLFINKTYTVYFLAFILSWFISSMLAKKFKKKDTNNVFNLFYPQFISIFLMLGIITVFIIIFNLADAPRFIIISSPVVAFVIELVAIAEQNRFKINLPAIKLVSGRKAFVLEFILYALIILKVLLPKFSDPVAGNKYVLLAACLYFDWFAGAYFGHKFISEIRKRNYWHFIWPFFRSYIIIISLNIFCSFSIRIAQPEFNTILYSSLVYVFLSSLITSSIYFLLKPDMTLDYKIKLSRVRQIKESPLDRIKFPNIIDYKIYDNQNDSNVFNEKLKERHLSKFPKIYEYLNKCLYLNSFNIHNTVILRSRDIYNVEILPNGVIEFFLNLHELNDIRRLNYYFIEVNKKLEFGGIYAGKFETNILRHKRLLSNYPYYIAQIFYLIDFIWSRIFPKIPFIQKIYFTLTKGMNRTISFAETLGRLYFCGFEIVNAKEIDNYIYFIVKKVKEPSKDTNPSYGPLFKMRRTGHKGKKIYVYKLRTMHPYAEYLQKFVFDNFNLQQGGKFNNDFRITSWGAVFRKLWIDELPMIINLFKGDLKLVGVRPLSEHYLSLYSDELRERRLNYKPGLVPPFYVDMPKTLEEIMKSEEKYLDSYDKNPILTDIKYFIKSFNNIIIKHARSK